MANRKEVMILKKNSERVAAALMFLYLIVCVLISKNLKNISLFDIESPLATMLASALFFVLFGFLLACTISSNIKKPIRFSFWLLFFAFLLIGLSKILYYAAPVVWVGNLVVSLIEISPLGQIGFGCYLYILTVHTIRRKHRNKEYDRI
ncbi:MAG: hypothetical protein PHC92_10440 [Syntrophomonadaceae bacterium]|nr:hypothetical protein [Syntrophomonadaceae bacterium]